MLIITLSSTHPKSHSSGAYQILMASAGVSKSMHLKLEPHQFTSFLDAELGWDKPKVDELLLPVIQKMGKRKVGGYV
jgi:hypothetical protein